MTGLDSSIMMGIRLRMGSIPRRVLVKHGGIYNSLGTKVAVCLEHAGEAEHSVKNTAPSSPVEGMESASSSQHRATPPLPEKGSAGSQEEGLTVMGLLNSRAVIGPGASSQALQILNQVIGRPESSEASDSKVRERGKESEGGREGRRASEFAKRRLSTWLNPKEAKKSWELYGIPLPVDDVTQGREDSAAARNSGAARRRERAGGERRRGRGRPPGSRRAAGLAEDVVRGGRGGADSPGCMSAQETPRAEKKRKHQNETVVAEGCESGELDVALLVLGRIRKETLRVVCGDFALQISGPRSMLVGRVHEVHQEALDSVRRHHGKLCGAAGGIPGAPTMGWLENHELKLATLELICCDLGLYKRGTKDDLRLRIFEHGQELAGKDEAGCSESRSTAFGAVEDACASSEDVRSECMTLEALRKDTLRLVCYDLDIAFSGPKHVLIPRILRKCEADRLAAGAGTATQMSCVRSRRRFCLLGLMARGRSGLLLY